MPLHIVLIALALIGLILFLVEKYIPMDPMIKTVIRVVVLIGILVWLINLFVPGFNEIRVGS